MAFHPNNMPLPMKQEWAKGPANWKGFVHSALRMGVRDIDLITSMVFYLRHPERNYRPLEAQETALIAEWKEWRKKVEDEPVIRVIPQRSRVGGGFLLFTGSSTYVG